MACMKCGSAWVTRKGKDKVSCPECCKQQRCRERKQGRLPCEEEKACERCGVTFTASGANAIAKSRYCAACVGPAREEYLENRKAKIKSGEWEVKPRRNLKGRKCLRCGEALNNNQSKYCGNDCYNAAKKEGIQSWDRTGQLESIWHRGGRWACAPSRKPIKEMRCNMQAFLRKVAAAYVRVSAKMPKCLQCGKECNRNSSEFCCVECSRKYREPLPCRMCGSNVLSVRNRPGTCSSCQQESRRVAARRYKRIYGRNHRKRARYHGVRYEPVSVKMVYDRDSYTCQICSKKCLSKAMIRKTTGKIHPLSPSIDHIVPMSHGGNHVESNLQTACFRCNTLKGSKGGGQLRLEIV